MDTLFRDICIEQNGFKTFKLLSILGTSSRRFCSVEMDIVNMTQKIEQKQEEELVTVSLWAKIKHWWRTLIREEWELTVFFPGDTHFLEDGSRIESGSS